MSQPPPRRWVLWVVGLYLASGLPFGVINNLVPVWLKEQGASLQDIGLATLIGLPWTLKLLWAPAVDRRGSAAAWVAGALGVVALSLGLLGHLPLGSAAVALLVLVALASATADVAIDGYTAAAIPASQYGRVNGIRVAAYRAAMLLAGGGAVALAGTLPWSTVFLLLAGAAGALGLLATRLPPGPREPRRPLLEWLEVLLDWVRKPGVLVLVAFVLTFKIGDVAMAPMVAPFWLDAGMSKEELGLFSTGLGAALTALGALLGGEIATRVGLFRALWTLGAVQALTNLGYAAAATAPSRAAVYAASAAESFGSGLGTAAFLAFLMRATEGAQTATRFAALTALAGLTRTLVGSVSGIGAERWGYAGYFALTFVVALPAFGLLPFVRRRVES